MASQPTSSNVVSRRASFAHFSKIVIAAERQKTFISHESARFADLRLGLVDSSVVALAELLGVHRLATRDVRHFAAVRLAGGRGFELVVHPTDPDRS